MAARPASDLHSEWSLGREFHYGRDRVSRRFCNSPAAASTGGRVARCRYVSQLVPAKPAPCTATVRWPGRQGSAPAPVGRTRIERERRREQYYARVGSSGVLTERTNGTVNMSNRE